MTTSCDIANRHSSEIDTYIAMTTSCDIANRHSSEINTYIAMTTSYDVANRHNSEITKRHFIRIFSKIAKLFSPLQGIMKKCQAFEIIKISKIIVYMKFLPDLPITSRSQIHNEQFM